MNGEETGLASAEAVAEQGDEASVPFVGRWNTLVSTTNWEKGRIIAEWRQALRESGAPASAWSDEAWSRLVGGVTGQHAGRLRRVFQRFGAAATTYQGLYWSHFHAAIDWSDAEMWLEGAVQNGWSVARMQRERWSVVTPDETPPVEEDAVQAELDEDFEPALHNSVHSPHDEDNDAVVTVAASADDDGDEADSPSGEASESSPEGEFAQDSVDEVQANLPPVKPFAHIAELPADMQEAFESFKLSILRHKASQWSEISLPEVLEVLDSLKSLAAAPSDLVA